MRGFRHGRAVEKTVCVDCAAWLGVVWDRDQRLAIGITAEKRQSHGELRRCVEARRTVLRTHSIPVFSSR